MLKPSFVGKKSFNHCVCSKFHLKVIEISIQCACSDRSLCAFDLRLGEPIRTCEILDSNNELNVPATSRFIFLVVHDIFKVVVIDTYNRRFWIRNRKVLNTCSTKYTLPCVVRKTAARSDLGPGGMFGLPLFFGFLKYKNCLIAIFTREQTYSVF